MKNLHHPNVVEAVEIFVNSAKKEVYQVLRYVEGKEILD